MLAADAANTANTLRIDIKKLARILEDLVILSSQVVLFEAFVANKRNIAASFSSTTTLVPLASKPHDIAASNSSLISSSFAPLPAPCVSHPATLSSNESKVASELPNDTILSLKIQDMMSTFYLPLESYSLSHSIRKALNIDSFDVQSEEMMSTCVEDVFFLLKKVLMRALRTKNLDTLCAMLNVAGKALEEEFLRDGLCSRLYTGFGGEKATQLAEQNQNSKIGYMILLNDLEGSAVYVEKLCRDLDAEMQAAGSVCVVDPKKLEIVAMCNRQLEASANAFKTTVKKGIQTLFLQSVRSRLRQLLLESFSQVKYFLSDEEFEAIESGGAVANTSSTIGTFDGIEKFINQQTTNLVGGAPGSPFTSNKNGSGVGGGKSQILQMSPFGGLNLSASGHLLGHLIPGTSTPAASSLNLSTSFSGGGAKQSGNVLSMRETFASKFLTGFNRIINDGFTRYLTDPNFHLLLQLSSSLIVQEWERVTLQLPPGQTMASVNSSSVMSNQRFFNALGAIRFDKDLRGVTNYLNQLLRVGSVRDQFIRLSQMSMLLNMDNAHEVLEFWTSSEMDESSPPVLNTSASLDSSPTQAIQWKLTRAEVMRILVLRFGVDQAKSVKL